MEQNELRAVTRSQWNAEELEDSTETEEENAIWEAVQDQQAFSKETSSPNFSSRETPQGQTPSSPKSRNSSKGARSQDIAPRIDPTQHFTHLACARVDSQKYLIISKLLEAFHHVYQQKRDLLMVFHEVINGILEREGNRVSTTAEANSFMELESTLLTIGSGSLRYFYPECVTESNDVSHTLQALRNEWGSLLARVKSFLRLIPPPPELTAAASSTASDSWLELPSEAPSWHPAEEDDKPAPWAVSRYPFSAEPVPARAVLTLPNELVSSWAGSPGTSPTSPLTAGSTLPKPESHRDPGCHSDQQASASIFPSAAPLEESPRGSLQDQQGLSGAVDQLPFSPEMEQSVVLMVANTILQSLELFERNHHLQAAVREAKLWVRWYNSNYRVWRAARERVQKKAQRAAEERKAARDCRSSGVAKESAETGCLFQREGKEGLLPLDNPTVFATHRLNHRGSKLPHTFRFPSPNITEKVHTFEMSSREALVAVLGHRREPFTEAQGEEIKKLSLKMHAAAKEERAPTLIMIPRLESLDSLPTSPRSPELFREVPFTPSPTDQDGGKMDFSEFWKEKELWEEIKAQKISGLSAEALSPKGVPSGWSTECSLHDSAMPLHSSESQLYGDEPPELSDPSLRAEQLPNKAPASLPLCESETFPVVPEGLVKSTESTTENNMLSGSKSHGQSSAGSGVDSSQQSFLHAESHTSVRNPSALDFVMKQLESIPFPRLSTSIDWGDVQKFELERQQMEMLRLQRKLSIILTANEELLRHRAA